MDVLPKFVDMAITPKERAEEGISPVAFPSAGPIYPYGLCLCFTQDELEKLNLQGDCEPGDMVHLSCMAKVTSISKNDTTEGTRMRIEMQITHIAAESEDNENEEVEEATPPKRVQNPYK